LRTDELPNGAELKGQLLTALDHALRADNAYARWAAAVEEYGCQPAVLRGPERRRGDAESTAAVPATQRLAELWNPLAARYGHPPLSDQDI
jgi:hypothetical protein